MEPITGNITAPTRRELINTAQERAAQWFGLKDPRCAHIELTNTRDNTAPIQVNDYTGTKIREITTPAFNADYTATIQHNYSQPAYGFGTCLNCGRSTSDDK